MIGVKTWARKRATPETIIGSMRLFELEHHRKRRAPLYGSAPLT
jgi:hypothetical protein